jgi:hypothetical protein
MYYFALLLAPERALTPAEGAAEMAAYQAFHTKAGSAIRAGDALCAAKDGKLITGWPGNPVVTDGPFAEGAEVAGGYYVLEADNLDDALELARDIPAAQYGAVEVWPMVHWSAPTEPVGAAWLGLLLEAPQDVNIPGTPEFEARVALHQEARTSIGDHVLGGAPLHPPATATTVRVRDGQVLLTDGPYAEGAEVANGFYLIRAADQDEAVKVASMIPAGSVLLRQLAGIAGL